MKKRLLRFESNFRRFERLKQRDESFLKNAIQELQKKEQLLQSKNSELKLAMEQLQKSNRQLRKVQRELLCTKQEAQDAQKAQDGNQTGPVSNILLEVQRPGAEDKLREQKTKMRGALDC